VDNLHDGELNGRTLRCRFALPQRAGRGGRGAVWDDADDYVERATLGDGAEPGGGRGAGDGDGDEEMAAEPAEPLAPRREGGGDAMAALEAGR